MCYFTDHTISIFSGIQVSQDLTSFPPSFTLSTPQQNIRFIDMTNQSLAGMSNLKQATELQQAAISKQAAELQQAAISKQAAILKQH